VLERTTEYSSRDTVLSLACDGFSNVRFPIWRTFLPCDCCCISYQLLDIYRKVKHLATAHKFFFRIIFITNFTCLLLISSECWIDELFLYGTADSIVLPTFSKFGGLRWMGSLSSAFLLAPTAFFSIFTWADLIGAWVVGFVQQSTSTDGM
jgi:hypothetical protein